MTNITKRTVDALKPGTIAWDDELSGFGVRCQKKAKTYVLKYRYRGKQRWMTIGKHGVPWTPSQAREKAKSLLGMVADGVDPAATRDSLKDRPTVKDLCERFMEDYAKEHKKPLSVANDESNIRNHVIPLLGNLGVEDVTRADIDKFKRAVKDGKTAKDELLGPRSRAIVTGGPGVANKCLALVSKMMNMAERWGWRIEGSNPCRHIDRYRPRKLERFLSEVELAKLSEVLTQAEHDGTETPYTIAAIRLLIFTGARLSEILNLEWDHVDTQRTMLALPDSKTGAKVIYLSAPALDVLSNIPRMDGNPFVICGDKTGARLVNLQKPWGRLRSMAGLEDVRLHDLRHSFASTAAAGGLSLPIIGKLLGHTQSATTERYAHLAADPLRAANEAIGARIAAVMKGDAKGAEVVELPKRGA